MLTHLTFNVRDALGTFSVSACEYFFFFLPSDHVCRFGVSSATRSITRRPTLLKVPSEKLQNPESRGLRQQPEGKSSFFFPASASHLFHLRGRSNQHGKDFCRPLVCVSFISSRWAAWKGSAARSGPACQSCSVIASQVTRSRKENCPRCHEN